MRTHLAERVEVRIWGESVNTILIESWSVGESNHVEDVSDGVIFVDMELSVVELSVHDDDDIGVHTDLVAHGTRNDADLKR